MSNKSLLAVYQAGLQHNSFLFSDWTKGVLDRHQIENQISSGTMIAINTVIHVDRSIGITKPLLRDRMIHFFKKLLLRKI